MYSDIGGIFIFTLSRVGPQLYACVTFKYFLYNLYFTIDLINTLKGRSNSNQIFDKNAWEEI
jgi:hypothetical protein